MCPAVSDAEVRAPARDRDEPGALTRAARRGRFDAKRRSNLTQANDRSVVRVREFVNAGTGSRYVVDCLPELGQVRTDCERVNLLAQLGEVRRARSRACADG